jgi:hypothetical protein
LQLGQSTDAKQVTQHGTKVAGVLLHALKVNSSHGSESECIEAATKQEHRVSIFAEL